MVQDPSDPDTIWQQNHMGMFRTRNGGDSWERIETGLPQSLVFGGAKGAAFGFPLVMDRKTRALYCVPLEGDETRVTHGGKLVVYRSRNGGDSWEPLTKGLPQENAYTAVLRGAMAADDLDPCGLYFGTTSGTIHVSADRGETWRTLPAMLPRILCVAAFVE